MQPEGVGVGGLQRTQGRGAAGVAHERGGPAHRRGGRGDLGIGHAQHDRGAATGGLAASERAGHVHAGVGEGARERAAEPARADDANTATGDMTHRVHPSIGPLRTLGVAADAFKDTVASDF
jgi:hypothetical protein